MGVSSFTVRGITPMVDSEDPMAFPLQLAFNRSTADFTMEPLAAIPELGTWQMLAGGGLVLGLVWLRRGHHARTGRAA